MIISIKFEMPDEEEFKLYASESDVPNQTPSQSLPSVMRLSQPRQDMLTSKVAS